MKSKEAKSRGYLHDSIGATTKSKEERCFKGRSSVTSSQINMSLTLNRPVKGPPVRGPYPQTNQSGGRVSKVTSLRSICNSPISLILIAEIVSTIRICPLSSPQASRSYSLKALERLGRRVIYSSSLSTLTCSRPSYLEHQTCSSTRAVVGAFSDL